MSILYPQYLTLKNKYCFAYYGVFDFFIRQLVYIKPLLAQQFPEVDFYISCKDDLIERFSHVPNMIPRSEFFKSQYAYVLEIVYNQIDNPIQSIIESNDLNIAPNKIVSNNTKKCLITPSTIRPFFSLNESIVNKLKNYVISKGYFFDIGDEIEDSDWVIGVENDTLYKAAMSGIKTTLIAEEKESAKVFTKLFPNNDLLLATHI